MAFVNLADVTLEISSCWLSILVGSLDGSDKRGISKKSSKNGFHHKKVGGSQERRGKPYIPSF